MQTSKVKFKLSKRIINALALALFITGISGLIKLNYTNAAESPTIDSRIGVQYDGTAQFDGLTYGPGPDGQYGTTTADPLAQDNVDHGNDSDPKNGIVRSGDDIGYKIQVNLNGADATDVVATISLSSGQFWQQVPGNCKTGSTISTDGLSLSCNLESVHQGTLVSFIAPAKVSPSTLNNTEVSASVSVTATGSNTSTATSEKTLVTSTPKVNLVKKILDRGDNFETLDPSTNKMGKVVRYGLGLYAEKGSEGLDTSTINITDTLTYPSSATVPTYKLYDWGPESACGQNKELTPELPYGSIGVTPEANASNSVVNSGSLTCSQGSGAGSSISLSLSGANTSPNTVPYKFPDGSAISIANNYLVAGYVDIWIPLEDFQNPDNGSSGLYNLEVLNTYSTIEPNGISGTSNYGPGTEDTSDNSVVLSLGSIPTGGHSVRVSFDGDANLGSKTGSVTSYAGGMVYPLMTIELEMDSEYKFMSCGKIDTSEMTFTGRFIDYGAGFNEGGITDRLRVALDKSPYTSAISLGPDGIPGTADDGIQYMSQLVTEPGWDGNKIILMEGDGASTPYKQTFKDPSIRGGFVEFSSKPVADFQNDTCTDSDGPWVTDPTTDPTNFPNGWASVTRVRYGGNSKVIPADQATTKNQNFYLAPELKINPSLDPAAGGGYGNPSEPDAFTGIYVSEYSGVENAWLNGPVPTGVNNPFDGQYTDRIELVGAQLRVQKSITNLGGNTEVKPGDSVDFKLKPTLGGRPGATTEVLVDDQIPTHLDYMPGSTVITPGSPGILVNGQDPSSTASIEPNVVAGKLQWTLSGVEPGDILPEIDYQTQVDIYATAGTLTNLVEVSETSPSPLDTRSTAAELSSAKSVRISNTGNYDIIKLLTTSTDALKEVNEPFSFDLTYANTSNEQDINDLQFIEVFPYNNDGPRDPISNYQGSLEFVSITSSLPGATYLYTDADPASINLDPCHNTNLKLSDPVPAACSEGVVDSNGNPTAATGETNWYDCSAGFSSGSCPIAQSDVTALKMAVSGSPALAVGDQRQRFTLTLQPSDNQKDDLYTNNFGSRVNVNDLVAISNDVSVRVVASTLGDRIWLDANGNGAQDGGEVGLAGVAVDLYDSSDSLIGSTVTDANGNYLFQNLHSGDYYALVDASTLPAGLSQTYDLDGLSSANRTDGNIGSNTDVTTWDFGYQGTGLIGGTVWTDTNENGVQDSGEAGMANVPITVTYLGQDGVLGGGDDVVINLSTDASGNCNLSGLPFGNYQVSVSVDNSYKNTYDPDGNNDGVTIITLNAQTPESIAKGFGYAKKSTVEQITSEVSNVVSSTASKLADTGENTKRLIALAAVLIVAGAVVVVLKRRR